MSEWIFVSYSHKDAQPVKKIVDIIERAGSVPVWFDDRLRGGENYFSVIAEQILAGKWYIRDG